MIHDPRPVARSERLTVEGVPVAPGLAVGTAVFHDEGAVDVPVLALRPEDVRSEHRRLAAAIRAARKQLADVEHTIEREVGRRDARIFSVQSLLLDDPAFRKAMRTAITEKLVNAEVAVRDAVEAWTERLAGVSVEGDRDPVEDLRDVGRQLLRLLAGRPRRVAVPEGGVEGQRVVLVTRELLPSDAVHLDRRHLAAIVTASGGVASHAAILARSLGIPAVTEVDTDALPARGGPWIVDGTTGQITLNPTPADLDRARTRSESWLRFRSDLAAASRGTARTRDGVGIDLLLNVESPADMDTDALDGLSGIGLFRTEYLFMSSDRFPSEEEQYEHYRNVLVRAGGRETTFRTIDVGGDKPLPYFGLPAEPNPVLGWRGIRLSLEWPDMFFSQLRALLRASAEGPTRIMVPMVTRVEEFVEVRAIRDRIHRDLVEHGVACADEVPLGLMIEVPAAALAADALAAEADFVSIGTNDLSQYALAVDRNNARVADLYDPLHPGVLFLVRHVIEACGRAGVPVSVCGEMAGDPEAALLLLGIGLRAFSMSPYHLPLVRRMLASVTLEEARSIASEVIALDRSTAIKERLRQHALRLLPELGTLLSPELPD